MYYDMSSDLNLLPMQTLYSISKFGNEFTCPPYALSISVHVSSIGNRSAYNGSANLRDLL